MSTLILKRSEKVDREIERENDKVNGASYKQLFSLGQEYTGVIHKSLITLHCLKLYQNIICPEKQCLGFVSHTIDNRCSLKVEIFSQRIWL